MRIEVRKCMDWLEFSLIDDNIESYWTETEGGLGLWKVVIYSDDHNLENLVRWIEEHQQIVLGVYSKLKSLMKGGD